MLDLILKLFMVLAPNKAKQTETWKAFKMILDDKERSKTSVVFMIVISLILIVEHVVIPVGVMWLVYSGVKNISFNEFFKIISHGNTTN